MCPYVMSLNTCSLYGNNDKESFFEWFLRTEGTHGIAGQMAFYELEIR